MPLFTYVYTRAIMYIIKAPVLPTQELLRILTQAVPDIIYP